MAVSKRIRFEVLRRDNYTCRYCRSADSELTIDHVTPVALGGTDDPANLVACCKDCNAGKASTSPDEGTVTNVAEDAVRWAAAMRDAAAIMSAEVDERDAYIGAFLSAWPSYRNVPSHLTDTVGRFYDLGLPLAVMLDAAETAGGARGVYDRPAYFAGICWKRVRAMQDVASRIMSSDSADGPVR